MWIMGALGAIAVAGGLYFLKPSVARLVNERISRKCADVEDASRRVGPSIDHLAKVSIAEDTPVHQSSLRNLPVLQKACRSSTCFHFQPLFPKGDSSAEHFFPDPSSAEVRSKLMASCLPCRANGGLKACLAMMTPIQGAAQQPGKHGGC